MIYLTKDNYISIEGLVNSITAKQNVIKGKYSITNIKDLMEVISSNDLNEWNGLQRDLDGLVPIYNKQKEY